MISNNYSKNVLYFRTPEILLFVTYLESPFLLRLVFGLPFGFMYILTSLYIINPEMIKPVIDQILYYLIPAIEASGWHFVP